MGELIEHVKNSVDGPIETLGGRVHVRLDEQLQVTSLSGDGWQDAGLRLDLRSK